MACVVDSHNSGQPIPLVYAGMNADPPVGKERKTLLFGGGRNRKKDISADPTDKKYT